MTLILSVSSQANNQNSKPDKEFVVEDEYVKVAELLKVSTSVIKQEKKRWQAIHSNPISDKVNITTKKDSIIIDIEIDTYINNMLNNQPITRTYTIGSPKNKDITTNLDFIILAMYSITDGLRPAICIGYRPFRKLNMGMLKDTGASVYCSIYSIGGTIYYCPIKNLSLHIICGYSVSSGNTTVGVGVGAQF